MYNLSVSAAHCAPSILIMLIVFYMMLGVYASFGQFTFINFALSIYIDRVEMKRAKKFDRIVAWGI